MYTTPRLVEALVRDRVAEMRRDAELRRVAEQASHELRRSAGAPSRRRRLV